MVEICAGAGGQAMGLERAGFEHAIAVELDSYACETLRQNRPQWKVAEGDVADRGLWTPGAYEGVALLAGGVPCPPFSIAGKQLGASDERDLFAWAVELCVSEVKPRALMLENVRGLSMPRFAAYRQHVLDRLASAGYVGDWRLLQASDFGIAQLRPRFVLVALQEEDAPYFSWPEKTTSSQLTVGETLRDLMGANGWPHVDDWVQLANDIAPTLVGGSKKHGGADLGPTRAKRAWRELGVDALGVADEAPGPHSPHPDVKFPKLTVPMVARLQGFDEQWGWRLAGRKTAQYRQVGNAFPPPVAKAVGRAIMRALEHAGQPHDMPELASATMHDPVYRVLREADGYLTPSAILSKLAVPYDAIQLERRIAHLSKDFVIDIEETKSGPAFELREFKAFIGQDGHERHEAFAHRMGRSRIS
ncbi:DNA (cytosine-5)-methyltransferase 1 [Geodermatophilus saharensis]|uniref:DNA (cytosine-5-)-methyltransferase n=1 Tax=Geodermatophilus saharensis TaxID=1137994 RepID=A0A239FC72_9ACTN|nr:DNA (cytosine-5-)-methyltransferase [Geodermatophilus saharensis]SNS54650.1 DNA (cytosine-5)-methyltransferase 1 [Geodermatophilus saharensis]